MRLLAQLQGQAGSAHWRRGSMILSNSPMTFIQIHALWPTLASRRTKERTCRPSLPGLLDAPPACSSCSPRPLLVQRLAAKLFQVWERPSGGC